MTPWTDRSGRLSYLKLATFMVALSPGLWISAQFITGSLGPLPFEALLDATGRWAIRFLLLSLLVTPVQRLGNWPRLVLLRRMIGLAALTYAGAHFVAFMLDQSLDLARITAEIAQRAYLAIGFLALLGLSALGATSTDGAIRRMGKRWKSLHKGVYLIAALGLTHFLLQAKIDATEPTLMAGLFLLLMSFRLVMTLRIPLSPICVLSAGMISGVATALLEYAWYALATGVDARAVLAANIAFPSMIRPAIVVASAGSALAILAFALSLRRKGGANSLRRSWARA